MRRAFKRRKGFLYYDCFVPPRMPKIDDCFGIGLASLTPFVLGSLFHPDCSGTSSVRLENEVLWRGIMTD
jgi:hypothetical protein